MKRVFFLTLLLIACVSFSAAMAAAPEGQPAAAPAAKVKAISFPPDKKIDLDMQATSPMLASGKATVNTKGGRADIEATFDGLGDPSKFGPEYLVYVLWAVTPEGKAMNLGTLKMKGQKGEITASANLQTFALGVTAEPYFAVTMPSDTVVLANAVPDKKNIQTAPLETKAQLLQRGSYKEAGLQPVKVDPKVPFELYQARNAVQIARFYKADQFAADSFGKATKALETAEATQKDKKGKEENVIMASRQAVQSAEDARSVAIKKAEEAELAAAQQKAASEAQQRAQAEAAQQQAQAQAQAATAQAAQAQAGQAQAQAQAQAATAQMGAARASAQQQRATLLKQLNKILATQDSDRGLVVTMAGVNFPSGSAELQPAGRENLAKLAGIIATHPSLKLDIEGYTDSAGKDETNQALSEKRAETVKKYLAEQGIPESSLTSKGLGKASPVTTNDTKEGRAKNRRVEIIVSGSEIGNKGGM
jgi:outer membrane protein OmpA-like peptidoglycan-associated protein